MFNSEFNNLIKAYSSIICQQKQKLFSKKQTNDIVQLIKDNQKKPLNFLKKFKSYVKEHDLMGAKFVYKNGWKQIIDPVLTPICKNNDRWNTLEIKTKMADFLGHISVSQMVGSQDNINDWPTQQDNGKGADKQTSQSQTQLIDQKAIEQYANEIGKYVKYLQQHKGQEADDKTVEACQQFEKITKDYFKGLTISPQIAKRIFQMGQETIWKDKDECKRMLQSWEIKVDKSVAKKQKSFLNKLSFGLFD